ncbi:hypothetical protein D8S78_03500 [Natrialba swarupiae]|nr:hypothetical protein [Natrialba swarupiae]
MRSPLTRTEPPSERTTDRLQSLESDDRAIEGLPIRLVIALVVGIAALSVMMNMLGGVGEFGDTEVTIEWEDDHVVQTGDLAESSASPSSTRRGTNSRSLPSSLPPALHNSTIRFTSPIPTRSPFPTMPIYVGTRTRGRSKSKSFHRVTATTSTSDRIPRSF